MKVTRDSLQGAVKEGILSDEQAEALYRHLARQPGSAPAFSFTTILYYFGGLTAIGLGIVYLGLLWQRNERTITRKLRAALPAVLHELLEERAAQ